MNLVQRVASTDSTAGIETHNLSVLVTRPAPHAEVWAEALRAVGVRAHALPLLSIAPVPDSSAVHAAWQGLAARDLVVFVSPSAIQQFFAAGQGLAWPPTTLAACTGPGSAAQLLALGVPAAQILSPASDAAQFDSEALWNQLAPRNWASRSVLVVRGEAGREWLADTLADAGARVDFLQAYVRAPAVLTSHEREVFALALAHPHAHVWLLSSSEAVTAASSIAGTAQWASAQALATHPRIAQTARALGWGFVEVCRPEVPEVVRCVQSISKKTTILHPAP